MKFTKGFTLIELLVVISIIGVLATIVLSSLGEARNKSEDSARVQTMKQIELALELYYLDNNEYPQANYTFGVNNAGNNYQNTTAINFVNDINPYLKNVDTTEFLLGGASQWGTFLYKSVAANNYQTYGAMIDLVSNDTLIGKNDGGYFPSTVDPDQYSHTEGHYQNAFEIGTDPEYCREKYFTSIFGSLTRCNGGN